MSGLPGQEEILKAWCVDAFNYSAFSSVTIGKMSAEASSSRSKSGKKSKSKSQAEGAEEVNGTAEDVPKNKRHRKDKRPSCF